MEYCVCVCVCVCVKAITYVFFHTHIISSAIFIPTETNIISSAIFISNRNKLYLKIITWYFIFISGFTRQEWSNYSLTPLVWVWHWLCVAIHRWESQLSPQISPNSHPIYTITQKSHHSNTHSQSHSHFHSSLTPWLWALSLRYTHSGYALWPHWRLWVPHRHNHCLYVRLCLNIAPFIMDSLHCPKTLRNIWSPTLIGAVRCIVCR